MTTSWTTRAGAITFVSAYRGCWLFQQDAPSFDRQHRPGHGLGGIDTGGLVARTRDISPRVRKWICLGAAGVNRSAN